MDGSFLVVDLQRLPSPCSGCGNICSVKFDSQEKGRFYPLLRKKVNCDSIMNRAAFCPFKIIRPPLRKPPLYLVKNFTMGGQCKMGIPWYIDNSAPSAVLRFNRLSFYSLRHSDKQGTNINRYQDGNALKPALRRYLHAIKGKHVAVIGTQVPWAEAVLLNLGADRVTTLEYRKLVIEYPRVDVITPFKFAEKFLNRTADTFDAAFSYSSIEHTGLGRYGDPLMPYGDMEAVAQIWCTTKPGGYLFLALPMTENREECILHWNAHRRYGYIRMQHLTANWKVLDEVNLLEGHLGLPHFNHFLYVLQKVEHFFH